MLPDGWPCFKIEALACSRCLPEVLTVHTEAHGGDGAARSRRALLAARRAHWRRRGAAQVSHLLWGLWGLIQARVSQLPDFDFTAYAQQRLEQYQLCTAARRVPG